MLKRGDGFSLLEAMMAMALFLAVVLALIPEWTKLSRQKERLDRTQTALNLLDDEMQAVLYDRHVQAEKMIELDGRRYQFRWERTGESGLVKACIRFNEHNKVYERCSYGKILDE